MPLFHHAMAGPLGRERQAVQLAREPDREVTNVDHLLHFAVAFRADLAHLERDEIAQRLLEFPERVAEIAHEVAALGRRPLAPRDKRARGFADHAVARGPRRGRHGRNGLSGRGIRRDERRAGRLVDPAVRAVAGARIAVGDVKPRQQRTMGGGWSLDRHAL
jgi:hypothetical protein